MRIKASALIVLILVLACLLALKFSTKLAAAEPTTWIVDDDGPADFTTIQAAVNAALSGDTIFVKAGTYGRKQINVGKPLQLIGENKTTTIIDGNGSWVCVYVRYTRNVLITGFTIQNGYGIYSWGSRNVNISGNIIRNNGQGVVVGQSTNNTLSENIVTLNGAMSIFLDGSNSNRILENNVTLNSGDAIWLDNSHGNIIRGNNVSYNGLDTPPGYHNRGIRLVFSSSNNIIYHNDIIDNFEQATVWMAGNNTWDGGYPSGGNYWSDYIGDDEYHGPNQDILGSDGIGDTPYIIDSGNRDNYPLLEPWPSLRYKLIVTTTPFTGVVLTMNGTSKITPYADTLPEGLYIVEMPQTPNGCVWSHWLEDSDTNRTKTFLLAGDIIWTGVFRFKADINGDGKVRVDDVLVAAEAFGTDPDHPRWNPLADLNGDDLVRVDDVLAIALNFGFG